MSGLEWQFMEAKERVRRMWSCATCDVLCCAELCRVEKYLVRPTGWFVGCDLKLSAELYCALLRWRGNMERKEIVRQN